MFSLPVRICLVAVAAAFGSYKLVIGELSGYAWLVVAATVAMGYLRYGAIRPAFMAMRRGDLKRAQEHVETIVWPSLLSAESRAYLHWVNGVIAAQDDDSLPYAAEQLRLALNGRIRFRNDRCIATATLAEIVARTSDMPGARQLLAEAQQIPHRETAQVYLDELNTEFGVGYRPDSR